jgi:hypothetical protein
MSVKSHKRIVVSFAALLLLLSAIQNLATACPPQCPPCYWWNGSRCVNMCDTGQYCCEGNCCNNGTTCCSGHCCDPDSCMTCQNKNCKFRCDPSSEYCCEGTCIPYEQWCCDGTPCDTECCGDECCSSSEKCCSDTDNDYCCSQDETCCDGSCCDSATELCCDGTCCDSATEYCCDGTCCQLDEECCDGTCCDPDMCEECVGGQCLVCGGRPGEVCCNGTCCTPDQCCDNGTCVDKCTNTGQCDYGELPSGPYPNCELLADPQTGRCGIIENAICGHVFTIAQSDAECADCEPGCDKERISACIEITEYRCTEHIYGVWFICLCDPKESYTSGNHYECAD